MAGPNDFLGLAEPMVDLDPSDFPAVASFTDGLGAPVDLVEDKPAADPYIVAMNEPPAGLDWTRVEEAKAQVEASAAAMGLGPAPIEELPAPPPLEQAPEFVPTERTNDSGQLAQPTYEEAMVPAEGRVEDRLLAPFETAEDRRAEYDLLSDEALGRVLQREDDEKAAHFAERQGALLAENRSAAEENERKRLRARAEADIESARLRQDIQAHSEREIDNTRWADSQSPLSRLGMVIGAGMGGFLKVMNGGRGGNSVLEAIDMMINQDIASQKADIANGRAALGQRQSLLGELRQTNADEFQAEEAARIVRLNQAANAIALEAEKYDPAGTSARAAMQMEQTVRAEAAKRQMLEEERLHKRYKEGVDIEIDISKEKREQAKFELDKQMQQAKIAKENRRGTGGPKKPSESTLLSGFKDGIGWDRARGGWYTMEPAGEGGQETKEQADRRRAIAEANRAEREVGVETLGAAGIVDKQGKPILFHDVSVAKDVSVSMGATKNGLELIDEMLAAIDKHGWSSDTLRSPEWQRAQANAGSLTLVYKDTEKLGALAGADVDLVEKTSGMQGDITGIRDPSEGLKQARRNLERKMNNVIQGYRPEAATYKFPERKIPKAEEIDSQAVVESVGNGLRPDIAVLPPADERRKASVAAQREKVAKSIANVKGPYGMRTQAKELAKKVEAGELTEEEAIDIASPLGQKWAAWEARELGKKHKSDIQKLSVEQLKDPDTDIPWLKEMKRLESLANDASQHPAFRREVWDYLTKEGQF